MMPKIFCRGEEISPEVLFRRLENRGEGRRAPSDIFAFGYFESLRVYRGRLFQEEEHLARLMESARTAGFCEKINTVEVRRDLRAALKNFLSHQARLPTAKKNREPFLFVRLSLWGREVFVMIGYRAGAEAGGFGGVRLTTSPVRRTLSNAVSPQIKSSDYLNSVSAFRELFTSGIFDRLILDQNGYVTETSVGNFFLVKDGMLRTPETSGILDGVTRRFVIKCALEAKVPVLETTITRHDVYNADEVFLTNTSREILSVSELDGRKIGVRCPGPLTERLRRRFAILTNR
jgi:branched-chain amino acid aminotransferase